MRKVLVLLCILVILLILLFFYVTKRKEHYVSNTYTHDKYVKMWHNHLFVSACCERINYTVCYHDKKYYSYKNGHFNIVLDGEPKNLKNIEADLIITTKKELLPKNITTLYAPYFMWSMVQSNLNPNLLIKRKIVPKRLFCCFAYSNCDETMEGVRKRKEFLDILNTLSGNRVDNIGTCYGGKKKGGWTDNWSIFAPYRFVIAFENNRLDGYITEKLIMPMISGCIPIYFGPDTSRFFNKKSIISVSDFNSLYECAQYVLKVDSDETLYNSILLEPYLKDNRIDREEFSMFYGGDFFRELQHVLPKNLGRFIRPCKLYSNTVLFTTFADGKNYRGDRIMSQAKKSGFFDICTAYFPKDIRDIGKGNLDFIRRNRRGFGYWVWKPFIILKALDKLEYGDFLIYCDSGTVVNPDGYQRFSDYLDICFQTDLVVFDIKYQEKRYTKSDTFFEILNFLKKDPIRERAHFESDQITAAFCCLKKTERTIELIRNWWEVCQNLKNIDDTPSYIPNDPSFIEHRHDQSCFSLLVKLCGFGTILHDNYEDSKKRINDNFPFIFARDRN